MPTSRRRHSITETPSVESALAELRSVDPEARVDLGDLVVRGARAKIEEIQSAERRRDALIEDLARMVLEGDIPVDPVAAEEVRRSGWTRDL